MQRVTYWLKRNNLDSSHSKKRLKIKERLKLLPNRQNILGLLSSPPAKRLGAHQISKTKRYTKSKKLAQVSSIVLLSLPANSIVTSVHTVEPSAYENVMKSTTITLASVPGDSTFFATDGFQHGFGYDLVRSYADELGVTVKVNSYNSAAEALNAVKFGQADMALTTASTQQTQEAGLAGLNMSCGFDKSLVSNGLHPKTNWSFRDSHDVLAKKASDFICDNDQLENTAKLAEFYDQSLMQDEYNRIHFEKTLAKNLPIYQSSFERQANNYDHDWALLVAMGYQESHLDANAVSPTGVRGLMMLTNNTAKAMGVSDRVDPYQSIGGGARYLEQMKETFKAVPNPDRLWFSLASYNMGPNAIKKVQRAVDAQGLDPNSWSNVYAYLSDNASSNPRFGQCMHYVTNIRSYLESIKTKMA